MSIPLPPLSYLALVASLFGLVCILRFSFYLGILERPISVAAIWGLCTGDWSLALPLGIFFELFWMDLLGAGTYIPPNANLPLLLCLFTQYILPLPGTNIPLILIILTLPTALLATRLEQWHRKRQINVHNRFVEDGKMEKPITFTVIARSLLELWLLQAALFAGLAITLFWLGSATITLSGTASGRILSSPNLTWPTLWLVAALGGILSLRTRRAVLALGCTLIILCILMLHNQILG